MPGRLGYEISPYSPSLLLSVPLCPPPLSPSHGFTLPMELPRHTGARALVLSSHPNESEIAELTTPAKVRPHRGDYFFLSFFFF